MNFKTAGIAFTATACMAMGIAHADLKYTQTTSFGGASNSSTTQMIRPGAQRTETVINMGQFKMTSVSLTLCKPRQDIKLDPKLKIYTVAKSPASLAAGTAAAAVGQSGGKKGTGKMVMTYDVKDLGQETVAGYKARHYKVTTTTQSSGCAGNGKTTSVMEYWVANVKGAVACSGDTSGYKAGAPISSGGCRITLETKGNVAAMQKVFNGLIVRMKMQSGGSVVSTTEISSISQAKLPDSLFKIPAGFKKVSEEDFQKAQSQAMAEAMKNG